ncbi:uncharacterized protein LOC131232430 [Magnolia sinica]|uniref:uncharacterized protein LOC131232430 n=1 Tax=Magnolia sinica TaxID=86752 RepID=UPI002659A5DD|nr:uncharacterized protein LOC131232430 [Magnolia sinica]
MADAKPYTESESFFVDASYYDEFTTGNNERSNNNEMVKDNTITAKNGIAKIAMSKKEKANYTMPLPEVERKKPFSVMPNRFHVEANKKNPEPIEFYVASEGEIQAKRDNKMRSAKLILEDLERYSSTSKRIIKNMGFDCEEPVGLNCGKEATEEEEIEMIKNSEVAPKQMEDRGQSTIDSLREINIGMKEEPQNIFISAGLSEQEANREVKYPKWISNIVLVKKKSGQIRVCIDFRDLNEVCPKDDFLLPITELLIDSTMKYVVMSFMDGYVGYNQIRMTPKAVEATAFRTSKCWCNRVMPFGLKNAGVTYQRTMQNIFQDMMHKHVECYVDDLVIRTMTMKNIVNIWFQYSVVSERSN